MENKLPEHIAEKISKEADAYELSQKGNHESNWFGYYNGSISWACKCQQMAEALSDLIEYQNLNRYFRPGLAYGAMCESQDKLKEANEKAIKLLATWNEGKEPNKSTTNDTNNQTSKKTLL